MTLPPVTAVADHRRDPASTQNSLPTPKNRCKSVTTTSTAKKIFHPTSPDLRLLHPTSPDMTRHFTPTASHHFTVRTTPVYGWPQSLHLVRAQTQPNRPKKENPPSKSVILRRNPSKPVPPQAPNAPNLCTIRTHRVHYPPSPPTSVIQFTRTVPYNTLQPFSTAQE